LLSVFLMNKDVYIYTRRKTRQNGLQLCLQNTLSLCSIPSQLYLFI